MLEDALDFILSKARKCERELVDLKIEEKEIEENLAKIRDYEQALAKCLRKKEDLHSDMFLFVIIILVGLAIAAVLPGNITIIPYLINKTLAAIVILSSGILKAIQVLEYLLEKNRFKNYNISGIDELVSKKDELLVRQKEIKNRVLEVEEMQERYNSELSFIVNYTEMIEQIKKDAPNAFVDPALVNNDNVDELIRMFEDYKKEYISPDKIHFTDVKELKLNKGDVYVR